jgi:hypothetical protein
MPSDHYVVLFYEFCIPKAQFNGASLRTFYFDNVAINLAERAREHNDDKNDYRERQQDAALGRRRIRIRNQEFPYQAVEELHALIDGDAANLCFAISGT